ncbi:hypothetical protein SUDANB6_05626 [Streptomyces sp. enrichment culture]
MVLGGAWFLLEVYRHGAIGVAERAVTTVQSVWPFVVASSCFRRAQGGERRTAGQAAGNRQRR